MRVRRILWDADGTLLNSASLAWRAAEDVLGAVGRPVKIGSREEYRREWPDFVRGQHAYKARQLADAHARKMLEASASIPVFDGTAALVERVSVHQAVVTSAFAATVRGALGSLANAFETIVGREAGTKAILLSRMDLRDAVYVGDTCGDVGICRNLGLPVIAVTFGFHAEEALRASGPDFLVATPEELGRLLDDWRILGGAR